MLQSLNRSNKQKEMQSLFKFLLKASFSSSCSFSRLAHLVAEEQRISKIDSLFGHPGIRRLRPLVRYFLKEEVRFGLVLFALPINLSQRRRNFSTVFFLVQLFGLELGGS